MDDKALALKLAGIAEVLIPTERQLREIELGLPAGFSLNVVESARLKVGAAATALAHEAAILERYARVQE